MFSCLVTEMLQYFLKWQKKERGGGLCGKRHECQATIRSNFAVNKSLYNLGIQKRLFSDPFHILPLSSATSTLSHHHLGLYEKRN